MLKVLAFVAAVVSVILVLLGLVVFWEMSVRQAHALERIERAAELGVCVRLGE